MNRQAIAVQVVKGKVRIQSTVKAGISNNLPEENRGFFVREAMADFIKCQSIRYSLKLASENRRSK